MKERIEQILEDKRMTQAEFATRAGISPSTITHLFNGRNNLSEVGISKILLAYPEINPIWLLEGIGEKYQKVNDPLPLLETQQAAEVEKQTLNPFLFMGQKEDERVDIQGKREENIPNISPVGLNIAPPLHATQAISQGTKVQKQIRKVVFFYTDRTFEEYYPE